MENTGNKWMRAVKWLSAGLLFVAVLVASAWSGISLAKKNLPAWAGDAPGALRGDELVIGGEDQAIYLAEQNQRIKDFFNRYRSVEERLEADADEAEVLRLTSEVKIRVNRRDAGTVSVEVLSGSLNGEAFWMPVTQLSAGKKTEDLPLIKDDR